jgi:hypothetical protein
LTTDVERPNYGASFPAAAMPRFVLAAALLVTLAACDNSEADAVSLRVRNGSGVDFSSVAVSLPGSSATYGAVAAGQASDYREFETAYRYAGVEVQAGGETYTHVPFDYAGEEPLAAGRYTYVLDVEGNTLRLELEQD